MEYNPALIVPLGLNVIGAFVTILFAKQEWQRNLAWLGLYGVALIAALDQIQQGGNYILWNFVAIVVTIMGGLESKKMRPNRLPRKERKALAQLFGNEWWRVFTEDKRLKNLSPDFDFGGLKL